MRDESDQPAAARWDGVDERPGGRDELLEPGDDRVAGERAPREGEVRGGRAIEAAELEHALWTERFRPPLGVPHERLEPAPGLVPVTDESV